jgi:hypothetical protein
MEENVEINQQQALNILVQAARIAQSKGAFTLEDAELVSKAIKLFIPKNAPENVINKDEQATEETPVTAEVEPAEVE